MIKTLLAFLPTGYFWRLTQKQVKYFIFEVIGGGLDRVIDYLGIKTDGYLLKNNELITHYKDNYQKDFSTKEDFIKLIQANNLLTKSYFETLVNKSITYLDNRKFTCNSNVNNNLGYFRGNYVIEIVEEFTQSEFDSFLEIVKLVKHQYTSIIFNVEGARVYL